MPKRLCWRGSLKQGRFCSTVLVWSKSLGHNLSLLGNDTCIWCMWAFSWNKNWWPLVTMNGQNLYTAVYHKTICYQNVLSSCWWLASAVCCGCLTVEDNAMVKQVIRYCTEVNSTHTSLQCTLLASVVQFVVLPVKLSFQQILVQLILIDISAVFLTLHRVAQVLPEPTTRS